MITLTGCDPFNSNRKPPADAKLTHIYLKNEDSFNKLVEMSNADSNVVRIASDFTRLRTNWAWPRPESELGFTNKRSSEYRSLLGALRLESGISRETSSNQIIILFISSSKGMTFCGSSKGFAYSADPLSPIFESLDQEESLNPQNHKRGIAFRRIKENWYLYFDW
jgi:hypothetical protein